MFCWNCGRSAKAIQQHGPCAETDPASLAFPHSAKRMSTSPHDPSDRKCRRERETTDEGSGHRAGPPEESAEGESRMPAQCRAGSSPYAAETPNLVANCRTPSCCTRGAQLSGSSRTHSAHGPCSVFSTRLQLVADHLHRLSIPRQPGMGAGWRSGSTGRSPSWSSFLISDHGVLATFERAVLVRHGDSERNAFGDLDRNGHLGEEPPE